MSFAEVYQARLVIEPRVARLTATHCIPEQVEMLRLTTQTENDTLKRPFCGQKYFLFWLICRGNRFLAAIVKFLLGVSRGTTEPYKPDSDVVHPAGLHNGVY